MKTKIPQRFKGIVYEPRNEQECVALFLLIMHKIKPTWCIKQLQTAFPDGLFYDTDKHKEIRVEFEYLASYFNHDENGCDMIICWENDLSRLKSDKMKIEILALKGAISKISVGNIFLGWKRERSLDKLIQKGIKMGDRVSIAVDKLVNHEIPKLEKKYSPLFLDRNQTRHYVLRWEGKGMFGVYPSGRLVAVNVNECIRKFGQNAQQIGKKFRYIIKEKVKGLNISPKASNKELEMRIDMLRNAIGEFCNRLERQV